LLQNPNIHHPKTIALGLTQEKILGISACSVRASVFTESDKVATWVDDTLNVVAMKLEHPAQSFQVGGGLVFDVRMFVYLAL